MSIREAFKAAVSLGGKVEKVELPGLPPVFVRAMTGAEFDEYEAACVAAGDKKASKANRHMLLRIAVCDADGKPAFGPTDEDFLKSLPAAVVNPLAKKAMELAGLGGDDPGNG